MFVRSGLAVSIALAAPSFAHGVAKAPCDGSDEVCREVHSGEETAMLQVKETRWPWGAPPSSGGGEDGSNKPAVAFGGPGLLAMSDFFGLTIGLLHSWHPENMFTHMYHKFKIMSGVGGGAWYSAQLAYSNSYYNMHARGSFDTGGVEGAYKNYLKDIISACKDTKYGGVAASETEKSWPHVKKALETTMAEDDAGTPDQKTQLEEHSPWGEQAAGEALMFLQNGRLTWLDFVQQMFKNGAGLDPDLPMGTDRVNEFASGKELLLGATAFSPSGGSQFPGITIYNQSGDSFSSSGKKAIDVTRLPVKFSAKLYKDTTQNASLPFCADKKCMGYEPVYSYGAKSLDTSKTLNDIFSSAFEGSAGKVPISSAVAASSALYGNAAVSKGTLGVWTTGAENGKSFSDAYDIRTNMLKGESFSVEDAKKAAKAGLQPLADGGMTDRTAIRAALEAGATSVLSYTNVDLGKKDYDPYASLYEGGDSDHVIFSSPSYADVKAGYKNAKRIMAKDGSKFLHAIAFQKVISMTKALPGIEGDRKVPVLYLTVETKDISTLLSKGNYSFNSIEDYSGLVGEIVMTLAQGDNDKVHNITAWFK